MRNGLTAGAGWHWPAGFEAAAAGIGGRGKAVAPTGTGGGLPDFVSALDVARDAMISRVSHWQSKKY